MNYEPTEKGYWGDYGGRFVPETLVAPLDELTAAYIASRDDAEFRSAFDHYLRTFAGRPSPLYFAERLTDHLGGAKIYLKREDLNHTGAHKINNCIGQILLGAGWAKAIIAETGAASTRRHCGGLCPFWDGMYRLYGHRNDKPPGAERLSDEPDGG